MSGASPHPARFWAFIILMLALTAGFVALGVWQLQRLTEKEALIAAVEERTGLPPAPPPPAADWPSLDPAEMNFVPLALTGKFADAPAIRVFTSLSASTARGESSGPGYWIVSPFVLDAGGTVFVNRGFVPQGREDGFVTPPAGTTTITGLARAPEAAGLFTPSANVPERIEWVRDPTRLAALVDPALAPFAPFTLDRAAGTEGGLPQGGETVVEFPNNHLGYAITWLGFAALTPVLLAFWIGRQLRR
ncbi:SURF1 family protein [Devosia nitrariae]|uniref:SURF1-like protein n=1 Tax=Devosia nitrariae TaxID=2071872 RepID=A0ABQ5VZI9_9HYPH|nr:SURF1 family cytochrome oxidase biogenesis protein [Devosia nitrariae]GLQ52921.1 SURF1-like protein [Devosia nitrariae]